MPTETSPERGSVAAFTPGPWKVEPMVPHAENAFYITATPGGNNSAKDVATVGPCLAKTTEPNARLIAAAPELYRILQNAVAQYDAIKGGPIIGALEAARAALAKARGEA